MNAPHQFNLLRLPPGEEANLREIVASKPLSVILSPPTMQFLLSEIDYLRDLARSMATFVEAAAKGFDELAEDAKGDDDGGEASAEYKGLAEEAWKAVELARNLPMKAG